MRHRRSVDSWSCPQQWSDDDVVTAPPPGCRCKCPWIQRLSLGKYCSEGHHITHSDLDTAWERIRGDFLKTFCHDSVTNLGMALLISQFTTLVKTFLSPTWLIVITCHCDPLTFPIVPSSGQTFFCPILYIMTKYLQIPAKQHSHQPLLCLVVISETC